MRRRRASTARLLGRAWWLAAAGALGLGCAPPAERAQRASFDQVPSSLAAVAPASLPLDRERPAPACPEIVGGAWPRALPGLGGLPRVVRGHDAALGYLAQTWDDGHEHRLRFLGAHLFDLLDKLAFEGGPDDQARRRVACIVLNDAAARGISVLRIWGSLKRTGTSTEVIRAADLLSLLLDENARRSHPLRFIVVLLNHQRGYGAPEPDRSLDEQSPDSLWHARTLYLGGGWLGRGAGLLAERIGVYGERAEPAYSPYVLAWELVNELDTFRSIAGGSFQGKDAQALRDDFLVPALERLAHTFAQPIMAGEVRGELDGYRPFAQSVVKALAPATRERLVWTSHVYSEQGRNPRDFTHKLEADLEIASGFGLPLILGELGEHVRGAEGGFCNGAQRHDIEPLVALLDGAGIESAAIWGEGRCNLEIDAATAWRLSIGVGGDSADIAPQDTRAAAALRSARQSWAQR